MTRPDLAYAVHLVSQFMSTPRSTHYAAVLRILRYIKGTLFYGLHFSTQSSCSNKQSVVARSSTEAEYRALTNATSELLWLRWLLTDIGAP